MADFHLIRDNMPVMSSDGQLVGHVSAAHEGRFAITPADGSSTGHVPHDWVSRIDDHVHLSHSAAVVRGRLAGMTEPRPMPAQERARVPWIIGAVFVIVALFLLVWGCVYRADGGDTRQPLPSTGQEGAR
jgi:hypothetical protein